MSTVTANVFDESIESQMVAEQSREIPPYKERKSAVRSELQGASDVILFDGDADGLGAASLLDAYYTSEETVAIPVGGSGHFLDVGSVFELLQYVGSIDRVFIVDYCLDEAPKSKYHLMELLNNSIDFYLFDHHEWTDSDSIAYFETHCEYLELDVHLDSEWNIDGDTVDERCTTQMIADYIQDQGIEIPETVAEKVRAVAVADLWVVDEEEEYVHPLADAYSSSADYLAFHTDPEQANWFGFEEWVEWFSKPETTLTESLSEYAEIQAVREEQKIAYLEENWDDLVSRNETDDLVVYAVYGNIDPNVVAKHLRQEYDADLCYLVRPNGYCSMRGSEQYENCDTICTEYNGGGHEKAGGFKIENAVDEFEKETYKKTNGDRTRSQLVTIY